MQGYKKIHKTKVQAFRRYLRKKKARWGAKVIIRGSGYGNVTHHQCQAPRRKSMNASRMRSHG